MPLVYSFIHFFIILIDRESIFCCVMWCDAMRCHDMRCDGYSHLYLYLYLCLYSNWKRPWTSHIDQGLHSSFIKDLLQVGSKLLAGPSRLLLLHNNNETHEIRDIKSDRGASIFLYSNRFCDLYCEWALIFCIVTRLIMIEEIKTSIIEKHPYNSIFSDGPALSRLPAPSGRLLVTWLRSLSVHFTRILH